MRLKKLIKSILRSLVVAVVIILPSSSLAQGDGGKKIYPRPLSEIKKVEMINGHEAVDLGLPSGVRWATCNLGASRPEEHGDYYSWGETQPKSTYTRSNSLTFGKSKKELQSAGIIVTDSTEWLPKHTLTPEYDAAHVNWGGSWRLPTGEEIHELLDSCSWKWKSQKGHGGFVVTGPNGNSIFLPVDGIRCDDDDYYHGNREIGLYWGSNPYGEEDDNEFGFCLELIKNSESSYSDYEGYCRDFGCSIRPVTNK